MESTIGQIRNEKSPWNLLLFTKAVLDPIYSRIQIAGKHRQCKHPFMEPKYS